VNPEDDSEVILLDAKRRSLLEELQGIDSELTERKSPGRTLTKTEFRMWRKDRARLVGRKNRIATEYRSVKSELIDRRQELRRAATEVERDLTEPDDLIAELLEAAKKFEAWRDPRFQLAMDAADRWLGRQG